MIYNVTTEYVPKMEEDIFGNFAVLDVRGDDINSICMTVVIVENNEITDYEYLVEEVTDYHDALWLINGIVEQRPVFVYSYEVESLIIGLAKKCDIIIPPINIISFKDMVKKLDPEYNLDAFEPDFNMGDLLHEIITARERFKSITGFAEKCKRIYEINLLPKKNIENADRMIQPNAGYVPLKSLKEIGRNFFIFIKADEEIMDLISNAADSSPVRSVLSLCHFILISDSARLSQWQRDRLINYGVLPITTDEYEKLCARENC